MKEGLLISVIDDHPLILDGFSSFFMGIQTIQKVYTCNNYTALLEALKEQIPDILFLDLNLGTSRYNGFTICKEVKENYKNIYVVIYTMYNDEYIIRKARMHGADAFLTKDVNHEILEELVTNFNRIRYSEFYCPIHSQHESQSSELSPDPFKLKELLTPSENKVFALLVDGLDHQEIEGQLHISYETLRSHRNNILRKLHLKNIAQLVKFAVYNTAH